MGTVVVAIQLDQNFSVYQYIEHAGIQNIFSDNRKLLAHWCQSIESTIIEQSLPLTLFACFQELDYFVPVMERYKLIAKFARHVFIFGVPSGSVCTIPNITYVPLSSVDQLRNEWFLIAHHGDYSRALIALEKTPLNTPHHERRFDGVLTSDTNVIAPIFKALEQQMEPFL